MSLLGMIADRKRLGLILNEVNNPAGPMKILDLGCGNGWFVKKLNSMGIGTIGIDINLEGETENLIRTSAYDLPFPENYFDCVLAIEIIEHLEPRVYKEIGRVLKPGGKLIVTSPIPKWNWLVEILCNSGLADPLVTPHMNCIKSEDLPFKLLKKRSFLLIEWFGVFENEK